MTAEKDQGEGTTYALREMLTGSGTALTEIYLTTSMGSHVLVCSCKPDLSLYPWMSLLCPTKDQTLEDSGQSGWCRPMILFLSILHKVLKYSEQQGCSLCKVHKALRNLFILFLPYCPRLLASAQKGAGGMGNQEH